MSVFELKPPFALFLGDAPDQLAAKTAAGVAQWRPQDCLGQVRLTGCAADLGLPDITVAEAALGGAATLLVGVANRGGIIGSSWTKVFIEALELGLDVASGLHHRLSDVRELAEAAQVHGRRLFDVRHPSEHFEVGSGAPRAGRRVLTVGTDCSVGKMYTALALHAAFQDRGLDSSFRATGQTGIFIAGGGICVDAVVADFISGAVESLAPAASPAHWDLIEGQGSLFHPSFAGVSLGLLHGAQPEAVVMCHEPGRPHMRGLPAYKLPSLTECIAANMDAARLVSSSVYCAGVALNTSRLSPEAARYALAKAADKTGLPCVDPVLTGVGSIVDRLLA